MNKNNNISEVNRKDIIIFLAVLIVFAFYLYFIQIFNKGKAIIGYDTATKSNIYKHEDTISIYIDKETKVNYIVYHYYSKGGICPRYNSDGSLYVSE